MTDRVDPVADGNARVPERGAEAAEALSYEQARDKLAAVVKRLEAGGLTLEQSLELWERGERLAAVCEQWLDGARARLAAVMAERGEDGGDAAEDEAAEAPFLSERPRGGLPDARAPDSTERPR
ncbi:MAG: exodeoxyribonuclease VII small subunit, partial [Streptosporangiaceae bacterium]|nr:exodeoxyribonuclease VII small subunit [Streptosporangiaceae bacterium]